MGYLTACFAMMVGPQGRAVGVDHIPELVAYSIDNSREALSVHAAGMPSNMLIEFISFFTACVHLGRF